MRSICCLLITVGSLGADAQTWTQLPDFPGSARDDAAAMNIMTDAFGSIVICVGTGMDGGFQLTNDWYKFDAVSQSWSTMASLPSSPRQYCAGVGSYDDPGNPQGYLFGGLDANGPLSELWRYDFNSDSWTQLTSLPAPGRYAAVIFTQYSFDPFLYVCTGMLGNGSPTNELWGYHIATDQWTQLATMPGTHRHRAMTRGYLPVVIGGADSVYTGLSDGYSYHSWNNTWTEVDPIPEARYRAAAEFGNVLCGASSLTELHDDGWYCEGVNMALPAFPGGPRRGGVSGSVMPTIYYGLGSDNSVRYKDWWALNNAPIGVDEILPTQNPYLISKLADASVNLVLPINWADSQCGVFDVHGRLCASMGPLSGTATIGTAGLSPGSYILHLRSSTALCTLRFTVQH